MGVFTFVTLKWPYKCFSRSKVMMFCYLIRSWRIFVRETQPKVPPIDNVDVRPDVPRPSRWWLALNSYGAVAARKTVSTPAALILGHLGDLSTKQHRPSTNGLQAVACATWAGILRRVYWGEILKFSAMSQERCVSAKKTDGSLLWATFNEELTGAIHNFVHALCFWDMGNATWQTPNDG